MAGDLGVSSWISLDLKGYVIGYQRISEWRSKDIKQDREQEKDGLKEGDQKISKMI